MQKMVLTDDDLLAKGNDRYVFQHPEDKQLLVKVVISGIPKYKSKQREVLREMKECQPHDKTDALYIQTIKGRVETSKGPGQVIVKECDHSGKLARTLYSLASANELDAEKYRKLNALLAWFVDTKVIFNSLHCKNIVYAWDNARQEYRFKIIDGFGDKTFLQLSKLSGAIRAKNKVKCLRRMLRDLERVQKEEQGVI